MTAPLFLVDDGRLAGLVCGSNVVLDGAEGRHATRVRRLSVGERLDLGDGAGRVCRATVAQVRGDALLAQVTQIQDVAAAAPHLIVVQALAKGDRDERAVETMTEVGVDAIVPWQAGRSITRWDSARAAKGVERWRTTAREAAKQSRRSWVPQISEDRKSVV